MDPHLTNPAGRLFLFLTATIDGGHSGNSSLRRIWSNYLGVDRDDFPGFVTAMVAMLQQADEMEVLVNRLVDPALPKEQLLRPVDVVRQMLANDLLGSSNLQSVVNVVHRGIMSDLEAASHILARSESAAAPVSADELAGIRALVDQIIALATKDSALDTASREAVLRYAHNLLRALDLYKVVGPQALVDELDRFATETKRLKTAPGPKLFSKLKELTGVIVMTVAMFTAGAEVTEAIGVYGDLLALPASTEAPGPRK